MKRDRKQGGAVGRDAKSTERTADDRADEGRGKQREGGNREQSGSGRIRLSWRKKLAFAAVTALVVLGLLEGGLWLFGVRPVIATEDPYVGFTSLSPLYEEVMDEYGEVWMQTAANKLKYFNPQKFAKKKPKGTYRIFCLGGSTAFGRPYDFRTAYSGWLQEFLPVADPSRRWEVINAGGISYASYREALLVEEACRYEPDLFIVYGSHNEFLEARTYRSVIEMPAAVRGLGALASRTHVYAAAHWAVQSVRGAPDDDERAILDDQVKTRLDRSVGPADYSRNDDERKQIVDHYRFNLARIVDTARANGAEVLLVQPASNLRDCSPFKSEHSPDVEANDLKRRDYRAAYDEAKTALDAAMTLVAVVEKAEQEAAAKEAAAQKKAAANAEPAAKEPPGNVPASDAAQQKEIEQGKLVLYSELRKALTAIDRAVALDPRYAEGHYLRGRILDQLKEFDLAREAYQRALDEDVCPLRAVREIHEAMDSVAAEREVELVDFQELISAVSPQGITDSQKWFLDHVHPSPAGHGVLAEAIVARLIEEKIVRKSDKWTDAEVQRIAASVVARITPEKHAEALRNLSKVLTWAGKFEEAERRAIDAAVGLPNDAEAFFNAATDAAAQGDFERALKMYELCLQIDPEAAVTYNAAGGLYERTGQLDLALQYYRKAVGFAEKRGEGRIAVQARTLAGGVLAKLDRLTEAEEELRQAIAKDPNYAEAHNKLGVLYAQQKRYDAALARIADAQRLDPRNAAFMRNEAALLLERGENGKAKDRLLAALEFARGDAATHATLADAYVQLDDLAAAEESYRNALRFAPGMGVARANLVRMLVNRGEIGEAEKVLGESTDPDVLMATTHLAWVLATHPDEKLRNGAKAVVHAERVRKRFGDKWARGLDVLAAAYAEAGRFDDAVTAANLAVAAAIEAKDDPLAEAVKGRLAGYREQKPFRDAALANSRGGR